MLDSYLPVLVIVAISAIVGLAIIILSTGVSQLLNKDPSRIKLMPYECGMDPIGDARRRFSVRFFLIGMLFIVFDIELIFFFPWATIFDDLRMFGFIEMLIFVLVLLVGLGYVWRKGALQWE